MMVVKRNGKKEQVSFDKITARIRRLAQNGDLPGGDITLPLDDSPVDPVLVAQKVVNGVYNGVTTTELDTLAAETAAYMVSVHPAYGTLAARISVSNLQKETTEKFSDVVRSLREYKDPKSGINASLISEDVFNFIEKHKEEIDNKIDYNRDYSYDFFGFKTLQRSYLLKLNGVVVERPQHMLMRVACGIHYNNTLETVFETYDLMSQGWFTHASPTLFNAGTPRPQLSSCFLIPMQDDSIEGIYQTLKMCALISKSAGGIGISASNIRASGSYIRGTNGVSNGLVPMLRVFNDTARYVDQGGGKRKGAFAIYLEPWHADIMDFLQLRKNHGKDEQRARDLFYGLWIPDLFMKRVEANEDWPLFCPNEAPGLYDCYGDKFEEMFLAYEKEGKAKVTIKAQELWFAILESQIETGTPYILFKDHANNKSNQKNLGTIRSSNLCTEIIEYSSKDEVAVCNLASIALPKYVNESNKTFDHQKLYNVVYTVTKNLNRIIDVNDYPLIEARNSNMRHRPVGLGVQGLADTFIKMRLPFESEEAQKVNKEIFETIYFAALSSSCDSAEVDGPYETFEGSPISEGKFQFDLWGVKPGARWDWDALRSRVVGANGQKRIGVRNSLLVAPMPTASTAQILGNNESFEPYTSNIYTRRVLAGEFTIVNKHLVKDLLELGLWTPSIRNKIIAHRGSVQGVEEIPHNLREIYKTVWEVKQKALVDLAVDRAPFIDQSMSFNIHMAEPTFAKLTSLHFYTWKKGLKTGMYYLRTRPAADAIQFTVDQQSLKEDGKEEEKTSQSPMQSPASGTARPAVLPSPSNSPAAKKRKIEEMMSDGPVCTMEEGCLMCGS